MSPRLPFLVAVVVLLAVASVAQAQFISIWNGTNGNWTDATRWSTNPIFPNNGQPNAGDLYNAVINGGTVTLDQNITIQGLTFDQNVINGAGNLTLNGPSTWTHGVMSGTGTTTFNGSLLINPPSFNPGLNRIFVNNSTTTWAGNRALSSTGTWNNQIGSLLDAQTDQSWTGGTINNNAGAILRKSAGAGTSTLNTVFNNAGLVEVNSGTLSLAGGGSSSGSGSFAIASGRTLQFNSNYTIAPGTSITGAGNLLVTGGSPTIDGTFSVAGNVTLNGGGLTLNTPAVISSLTMITGSALSGSGSVTVSGPTIWTQGTMSGSGTTTFNGPVTFNNTFSLGVSRTINAHTTTTWTSSVGISGSGVWNNQSGALFDIQNNAQWNGPAFNNLSGATLQKSAGTGISLFAGSPFTNSGTILAQTGTIAFNNQFTQNAGSTVLAGGAITANNFPMNFNGGSLTGAGTITGSASFGNATIAPGNSPGTIAFTGNLSLSAGSVLDFELGTISDLITVGGNLTLDGSLNVTGLAGFDSGTFTLIDYTGTLTNNGLNVGIAPSGFNYQVVNDLANTRIDLVVAAIPEPSALLLTSASLMGCGVYAWQRRAGRRRLQRLRRQNRLQVVRA